ncbi:MAG TPA: hypothetical protein VL728_11215 [Cyclobacteriaceae bacterium]|jgi:hypothetical protein|nr:hypothetical protein [Cyclobacteriaceae bacterium]
MHKSIPIIILSCLFIIAGVVGVIYHADDLKQIAVSREAFWVLLIRLLAIIGGVFALRRKNWARWLLLGWISYHVILSLYHPLSELLVHVVLLVAVAYFYFLSKTSSYFSK